MTILKKSATLALSVMVFAGGYGWDGPVNPSIGTGFIAPAEARVGRPLTPVSYAGVARRTTRRVVGTTAAVAASTPAPTTTVVVATPAATTATCVDTVDANGVIRRTCQ
mgnify:CR=1 FL=1